MILGEKECAASPAFTSAISQAAEPRLGGSAGAVPRDGGGNRATQARGAMATTGRV